jgi:16S rRNA (uracil1498-N3)-methyltransferase
MPAGRFYVEGSALAPGAEIELTPEIAHQARDVLRLVPGGTLHLLDGAGGEYHATVLAADRRHVVVRLGERVERVDAEPPVRLVLCQGVLKAAKFELVLQRCTELGVAAFVPLLTERAVAAADEASESKRRRWTKIVAEAMEQCGGTRLPELSAPRPLLHALASLPPDSGSLALIPWEEERATSFRSALHAALAARTQPGASAAPAPPGSEVRLFIGPEGGFSAGEIALARRHGAIPVTLGRRILRAETAAIVAVTLALDALGALSAGPPPPRG